MLAEIWPFVEEQRRAGRPVVLARLVGRDGPGARPLGATLALTPGGAWRGSLSGGCVEAMVIEEARTLFSGAPPRVTTVSPGAQRMPWEDAPACAAELRILITHAPEAGVHEAITAALARDLPLAVRVGLSHPYAWSTAATASQLATDGAFVEELPVRPRLVLVGATDLAAQLAVLAEQLGRRVTVVDPRPGHVASGALPDTADVVQAWPDAWLATHPAGPADAVLTLSHDPRIDDRGLRAALAGEAGYVGALGSRATHALRAARLAGTPGLDRLAAPAGLDLGGTSTAETALSILAEIVATAHGRTGRPLREGQLPIQAGHLAASVPRGL